MSLPRDFLSKLKTVRVDPSPWTVIVSLSRQTLTVFRDGEPVGEYRVSTSARGPGQLEGSQQTPLGLHRICEKIGEGAAAGAVFKSRKPTGEIWKSGQVSAEDLILSRILWLDGLEENFNRGRDAGGKLVDSHDRYIYIHGTNQEAEIGRPGSHGCVRMTNADVISLFNQVPVGTLVWLVA